MNEANEDGLFLFFKVMEKEVLNTKASFNNLLSVNFASWFFLTYLELVDIDLLEKEASEALPVLMEMCGEMCDIIRFDLLRFATSINKNCFCDTCERKRKFVKQVIVNSLNGYYILLRTGFTEKQVEPKIKALEVLKVTKNKPTMTYARGVKSFTSKFETLFSVALIMYGVTFFFFPKWATLSFLALLIICFTVASLKVYLAVLAHKISKRKELNHE